MVIHIVNWLLTRRCNLSCDYCNISKGNGTPEEYPSMPYYIDNEMSSDYIIEILRRLKLHNPNCFMVFYGGEPLLRDDLSDIIMYCNNNDIQYSIITNSCGVAYNRLLELIEKTDVMGIASSVDPVIFSGSSDLDRIKKSYDAIARLESLTTVINDVMAEITVDKYSLKYLTPLVELLTSKGINSSITFIDISKSEYYDFSNIKDDSILVNPDDASPIIRDMINRDDLDINMKNDLLNKTIDMLPSNQDCKLDKNIHNITIDSDGSVRLCLRIRGVSTPKISAIDYIRPDGTLDDKLLYNIKHDKLLYCLGCNWTCTAMSQLIEDDQKRFDDLRHSDRRN